MPLVIQGVEYFSHNEVADRVGVHRTTLSRWKKDCSVPTGQWFPRGKQVLYTASEVLEIEAFAFRLEPIGRVNGAASDHLEDEGASR
jgi:transposase-like protein